MTPWLGNKQRRASAVAVTLLSVMVMVGAVLFLFIALVRFFAAFDHVFLPLTVAALLALIVRPWYDWLRLRARLPTPLALLVLFLSLILPFLLAIALFGSLIVQQLLEFLERVPDWWREAIAFAEQHRPALRTWFNEHPIGLKVRDALESSTGPMAHVLGFIANSVLSAGAGMISKAVSLFGWFVMPVYLAFFLLMPKLNVDSLESQLTFLKSETRRDAVFLLREFVNLVVVFFRSQMAIAFIQGVLFAIGFTIAGLRYGAVLGLLLGMLNLIPYLGSVIGLGIGLPMAYFQADGGWSLLGAMLIVFAVVQLFEGYFLTPRIMGDRTGLHPLVIIVAIFFWGSALDGILGMILAIPLTAFLVVFWRLAREKYITELV